MKKVYYFLFSLFFSLTANSQIEGTWKLAPRSGALAVGPSIAEIGVWWSSDDQAVIDRYCIFDDSIKFDASGVATHYMNNETWIEAWQGLPEPACNTPVYPHDGFGDAGFTYTYNSAASTLTMIGKGAHIGLAKVINGSEITSPDQAPESITYNITFSNNNNTMTADIDFGTGWWRFIYDRTTAPPVENPNVTFSVDMSQYTGTIANGVFLNGTFNGWCGECTPMTNVGNNIWEVSVSLPVGSIQYKFTIDGWNAQEEFADGLPCIDLIADGFNNRAFNVTESTTLPTVCFNSCSACTTVSNSTITLNAAPANGGTTSGGGSLANGTSTTVTATPNTGFNFINWSENGNVVSTTSSYTFTVSADRTLIANFESTSSIGENKIGKIKVYPNPSKDYINIQLSANEKCNVELIDIKGKTLIKKSDVKHGDKLDIKSIENGTYFLKIVQNEETIIEKISKI